LVEVDVVTYYNSQVDAAARDSPQDEHQYGECPQAFPGKDANEAQASHESISQTATRQEKAFSKGEDAGRRNNDADM